MGYFVAWGVAALIALAFIGAAGKANKRYDEEIDRELADRQSQDAGKITWH